MATTVTNPFEAPAKNPFAVTAPGMPSAAAATTTTAGPAAQASAPGQAATREATSSGYDAATATTERANATMRTVQDNELVQNQIAGIISGNSPLLQRARQQSLEASNARGLINSSMAVEAGQAAVIDKALPIAQQDAQTFGTASQDNQKYRNSADQFNAGETNTTSRANAGLISTARQFTADAGNRAELNNADATNRAALQTNQQQAAASQFNAGQTNETSRFNAGQTNETSRFNAGQTNDMARAQADMSFRAAIANADNSTRTALSRFEQESANQRQNSATSSEIYRQFQTSATNLMLDDRLDGPTRSAMVAELQEQTRRAMIAAGAMDQLEIDNLLQMERLPTNANGATAGARQGAAAAPAAGAATAGGYVAPDPNALAAAGTYSEPYVDQNYGF